MGVPIKDLVEVIVENLKHKPQVVWDTTKPAGDKIRLMDMSRAQSMGFKPQVSLEEGIGITMEWYAQNREQATKRYNVFNTKNFV